MHRPTPTHPTRRSFLLGAAASSLALLAACGDDGGGGGAESGAAGEGGTDAPAGRFTFTDDRGEAIDLDAVPRRIVAWQTVVPALVDLGIEPVGVIAFNPLETNPSFQEAGVDTDALVAVSTELGEIDLEQLAALEPDLIVGYVLDDPELLLGFADAGQQERVAQLAPLLALDGNAEVLVGIERMEELARALGADLEGEDHRAAVAAFDEASEAIRTVAAEREGLTVAFGGAFPQGIFLATEAGYPELRRYAELGLDVLYGEVDEVVSWEQAADLVQADVLVLDDRVTDEQLAEVEDIATWPLLPPVEADQVHRDWRFLLSYSHAEHTRTMQRMLPALEAADPAVV